ncbi:murein hydrolase activator EnvC family protein [Bacillus massilioanorexius]|nr:glucosaminidase domain-containing protein [Bacillus massilioanorexius]
MFSTVLISTFLFSFTVHANPNTKQEVSQQLKNVGDELQTKTAEAKSLENKKKQVYREWKDLSIEIAALEIQQYQQTSDLLQVQSNIANLEVQEKTSKDKMDKRYTMLAKRLTIMQEEQSYNNIVSILLSSNSIADFFSRYLAVSYIMKADQDLIDSYEKEVKHYNALKIDAKKELEKEKAIQRQLKSTKTALVERERKQKQYMNELNTQYGWTIKDVQSLQTRYDQLEQQSAAMKEKEKQEAEKNTSNNIQYDGKGGFDVRGNSGVTVADLDKVLSGYLKGYGSVFYEVGEKYGINPAFLMAVAMSETGGDSNWLKQYNNVGGFTHNGPMKFASIEDSIHYMGSLLSRLYIRDGLYTVEAIHSRYSPQGASNDHSNSNAIWVNNVYKFLSKAGIAV